MQESEESLTEASKATQEIAKTTGRAIESAEKLGRFIARFVSGSLEQATGIVEDKLKYMRWERQVRLMLRAEDLLSELGLKGPTRPVPLKFAIPLLQAASLEDDDELQNLWAQLLVNAANAASGISLKRVYIEILESIGSLEMAILQTVYSIPFDEMHHKGVITSRLPSVAEVRDPEKEARDDAALQPDQPSPEVELALANLGRLGCLSPSITWGGGQSFRIVNPTKLGQTFVDACTLQRGH